MDSINLPSILTPDLGLFFWMFLAFLTVFLLVSKFGFPIIVKMVDDRKNYIDESLRKAHEANERLAGIQQESERLLQEARDRQAQILQQAKATGDGIVQEARNKAQEEGAKLLADAKHVEFQVREDPSLLGGFVLEYDTYRMDASVKAQLARIKRQLAAN